MNPRRRRRRRRGRRDPPAEATGRRHWSAARSPGGKPAGRSAGWGARPGPPLWSAAVAARSTVAET